MKFMQEAEEKKKRRLRSEVNMLIDQINAPAGGYNKDHQDQDSGEFLTSRSQFAKPGDGLRHSIKSITEEQVKEAARKITTRG